MALPTTPPSRWIGQLDSPFRMFEQTLDRWSDYDLYEEDDEFVLTVNLPGFDPEEISLSWSDGVLNVAAEHNDEERGQQKTYHRRFRFPKDIVEADITAKYNNGVLEVHLPQEEGAIVHGTEIPIEH